jgi:hypothetical protein
MKMSSKNDQSGGDNHPGQFWVPYPPPPGAGSSPANPGSISRQDSRLVNPQKTLLRGFSLAVIGMVLFLMAMGSPWYKVSSESSGEIRGWDTSSITFDGTSTIGIYNMEPFAMIGSQTWSQYIDHYKVEHAGRSPSLPTVYAITRILAIIAIVLAIIAVVLVIIGRFGKIPAKMTRMLTAIMLLGAVVGFVAIGYFAVAHPIALQSDYPESANTPGPVRSFAGNASGDVSRSSWGPDIGWMMELVGAILLSAAAVLRLRKGKPLHQEVPSLPG